MPHIGPLSPKEHGTPPPTPAPERRGVPKFSGLAVSPRGLSLPVGRTGWAFRRGQPGCQSNSFRNFVFFAPSSFRWAGASSETLFVRRGIARREKAARAWSACSELVPVLFPAQLPGAFCLPQQSDRRPEYGGWRSLTRLVCGCFGFDAWTFAQRLHLAVKLLPV